MTLLYYCTDQKNVLLIVLSAFPSELTHSNVQITHFCIIRVGGGASGPLPRKENLLGSPIPFHFIPSALFNVSV